MPLEAIAQPGRALQLCRDPGPGLLERSLVQIQLASPITAQRGFPVGCTFGRKPYTGFFAKRANLLALLGLPTKIESFSGYLEQFPFNAPPLGNTLL